VVVSSGIIGAVAAKGGLVPTEFVAVTVESLWVLAMEMATTCSQRNATPWPFIKIDDFVSSLSVLKVLQMAMRTRTKNQSKNLALLSHQVTKKSSART
jgi:hypothetical protein